LSSNQKPSYKLQRVIFEKVAEWRYTVTILWILVSVGEFLNTSWLGINAVLFTDRQVHLFWTGRLTHVQGMTAGLLKMATEPLAQGVPTGIDAFIMRLARDDLHKLIGQYGEEVAVGKSSLWWNTDAAPVLI